MFFPGNDIPAYHLCCDTFSNYRGWCCRYSAVQCNADGMLGTIGDVSRMPVEATLPVFDGRPLSTGRCLRLKATVSALNTLDQKIHLWAHVLAAPNISATENAPYPQSSYQPMFFAPLAEWSTKA